MKEIEHPPFAPSLLESMRSVGYSLESALADILDNSISADASEISIQHRAEPEAILAVIDNGRGMSSIELANAMRHGSSNPTQVRNGDDLGRYGLGLKTASLSQCRKMTVISLRDGDFSGLCWDLDVIAATGKWTMLSLEESDMHGLPYLDKLREFGQGTIVYWERLDRLLAGESSIERALSSQMDIVRNHLALVFHRYIDSSTVKKRVRFLINEVPVPAVDPFLADHPATQRLDDDQFTIDGQKIAVKPFILPHMSKLTQVEIDRAGGNEGLRNQQGFYVYRNRRLIIWGTWFRLSGKDELGKLARVRVDIPNSLDHLWTLDIKKSAAFPPEGVRNNLKRTLVRIKEISGRTISFRGKPELRSGLTAAWIQISDREGTRFEVNQNHPLLLALRSRLSENDSRALDLVISTLQSNFPSEALYANMASDVRVNHIDKDARATLVDSAKVIFEGLARDSRTWIALMESIHLIEPFNKYPEFTKQIVKEIRANEQ